MDKMVYLYSRYLSEICHCYADENGNRPCDNGAICDPVLYYNRQEGWGLTVSRLTYRPQKIS